MKCEKGPCFLQMFDNTDRRVNNNEEKEKKKKKMRLSKQ